MNFTTTDIAYLWLVKGGGIQKNDVGTSLVRQIQFITDTKQRTIDSKPKRRLRPFNQNGHIHFLGSR